MKPGGRADHPIELLSASIDRELRPAESASLEAHLEACAECRGLLVDFRRLNETIAAEPTPPVPAGLEERILAELPSRRSPAPARSIWRQAMPLAAAASLVMAVLLWSERPDRLPSLPDSNGATAPDAAAPVTSPAPTPGARRDAPAVAGGNAPIPPESKQAAAASDAMKKTEERAAPRKAPPAPSRISGAQPHTARRAAPAPAEAPPSTDAPGAAAPAWSAAAPEIAELQAEAKQKEPQAADAIAVDLLLLPLCESTPASPPVRGKPAGASAVAAARPVSRPFALLASPYAVRLEPDRRLRMERGDYACTVAIDDRDGLTVAAALEESLRSSAVSPATAQPPCLVQATPAARQAVVRLIQERYRGAIETYCGALPKGEPPDAKPGLDSPPD